MIQSVGTIIKKLKDMQKINNIFANSDRPEYAEGWEHCTNWILSEIEGHNENH
jgi:hypothetical protein